MKEGTGGLYFHNLLLLSKNTLLRKDWTTTEMMHIMLTLLNLLLLSKNTEPDFLIADDIPTFKNFKWNVWYLNLLITWT